jgi:hypothetical protein
MAIENVDTDQKFSKKLDFKIFNSTLRTGYLNEPLQVDSSTHKKPDMYGIDVSLKPRIGNIFKDGEGIHQLET